MTVSATTIITEALRVLTVVRTAGQTPSSVELTEGLLVLNFLLDSYSINRLLIPVVDSASFPLTANTASYTIGTGATFNASRPIRIDSASIVQTAYNSATVVFQRQLELITETQYQQIHDKTATGDVPQKLYYSPDLPNGTLYLWPIPLVVSATSIQLSTWSPLTQFPDLTTTIGLAPGYQRFLTFQLAIHLAPQMPGAVLTPETMAAATESEAFIMKLNSLMVPVQPDGLIPPATNAEFEPVPSNLKAVAQAKFGGGQS